MPKIKSRDYEIIRKEYPEFDINTSRNKNTILRLYNQRFNHLIALYPSHYKNRLGWVCKCDCGNYTFYGTDKLISGEAVTCGPACPYKKTKVHDLTNQKFGRLLVLERSGSTEDGHALWKCQCDCGNITYVAGRYLEQHRISSCGKCKDNWTTHSSGETIINNWLIEHNIDFEREYIDSRCSRGAALRFDFKVNIANQYFLIEYQGIQHYKTTGGWFDETALKDCQERDAIKLKFCQENNIKLLRISYEDEDKISDILTDFINYFNNARAYTNTSLTK